MNDFENVRDFKIWNIIFDKFDRRELEKPVAILKYKTLLILEMSNLERTTILRNFKI